ncbi:MAG: hypothetical protein VR69_08380 [Peptococcaceae bacterium BRH_c4b]|nr:MAG: hypothetical protein VR69_08380 [Peptococcaceae bacterium BRH_c4b]
MNNKRILVGCISVGIFLFMMTGIISFGKISSIGNKTREINENLTPNLEYLGVLNGDVSGIPRLVSDLVLETNEQRMKDLESEIKLLLRKIDEDSKDYQIMITSYEEKELYNEFEKNWNIYLEKLPAIIEDGKANKFDSANKKIVAAYPFWKNANDKLAELITVNKNRIDEISSQALTLQQTIIVDILVAILIGNIVCFVYLIDILRKKE